MLPLSHVILLQIYYQQYSLLLAKTLDLGKQNHLQGGFLILRPHCHFVVRAFFYMRRRVSRVSHMTAPHHGSAPACFCTIQNTTCTRTPMWSRVGTSYFKTGYPLPVDRFRLSPSGRFNLGCISPVAYIWSHPVTWSNIYIWLSISQNL